MVRRLFDPRYRRRPPRSLNEIIMMVALLVIGFLLRVAAHQLLIPIPDPIDGTEDAVYASSRLSMNADLVGRFLMWLASAVIMARAKLDRASWMSQVMIGTAIVALMHIALRTLMSHSVFRASALDVVVVVSAVVFFPEPTPRTRHRFRFKISHVLWLMTVAALASSGYSSEFAIAGWWQAIVVASLVGILGSRISSISSGTAVAKDLWASASTLSALALLLWIFGMTTHPIMLMYTHHGLLPLLLATSLTLGAVLIGRRRGPMCERLGL